MGSFQIPPPRKMMLSCFAAVLVLSGSVSASFNTTGSGYEIFCLGHCEQDSEPAVEPATVLMGGHMYPPVNNNSTDLDAYRYLLSAGGWGDVVVLTSDPDPCDVYNPFIFSLGPVHSVTTLCIHARNASFNSQVLDFLHRADALFITGGDQALYWTYWKDSPLLDMVNSLLNKRGVPLGGSSAGLAVQGQYVFNALTGGTDSEEALNNPRTKDITIGTNFLDIRPLRNVITDTHYYQRDRMGRH